MVIKINPNKALIIKKLDSLRSQQIFSAAMGDYKGFKTATKEYAAEAVNNFELLQQLQKPRISVPLFSKTGMHLAKIWFLNLFRKKTPAEKLLKKMSQESAVKAKIYG